MFIFTPNNLVINSTRVSIVGSNRLQEVYRLPEGDHVRIETLVKVLSQWFFCVRLNFSAFVTPKDTISLKLGLYYKF